MKILVTGGGTGGHVFPALEVARGLRDSGREIAYWGSLRGMEGTLSQADGFAFRGFDGQPLWSLKSAAGWSSLVRLIRASAACAREMRGAQPDRVFSTGGYSAAPILWAARRLGVPYVMHEANSVPGRVTRMFAPRAKAVNTVFRASVNHLPRVSRLGQPVRAAIRAIERRPEPQTLLVMGGSQGAKFLNDTLPAVAGHLDGWRIVHAAGKGHSGAVTTAYGDRPNTDVHEFLSGEALRSAFTTAGVFVGRSGGTLAELAALRLPSVLVPLPTSADDHQRVNAREFEAMGAAKICEQPTTNPQELAAAILDWNVETRAQAEAALAEWDLPSATIDLVDLTVSP